MQPSRNTQWHRIRLTQTASEAGVLTSRGSVHSAATANACLAHEGNSFNTLGSLPQEHKCFPPPLRMQLQAFRNTACLAFALFTTTSSSAPPTNTLDKFRQVQLNHLRWAKRSGPWNFVSLIIESHQKALHASQRAGRLSTTQKQLCLCICDASLLGSMIFFFYCR